MLILGSFFANWFLLDFNLTQPYVTYVEVQAVPRSGVSVQGSSMNVSIQYRKLLVMAMNDAPHRPDLHRGSRGAKRKYGHLTILPEAEKEHVKPRWNLFS